MKKNLPTDRLSGEPDFKHQVIDALSIYGDLAGSEALTRAIVAERNGDRHNAGFWADVFLTIASDNATENSGE